MLEWTIAIGCLVGNAALLVGVWIVSVWARDLE
jgi:hypothetical protein